ncbi:MAG: hypothetical protein M3R70_06695 [Actinomycetota bacterium]|nr:hypothetical protein [Actinomycetota bacterium]
MKRSYTSATWSPNGRLLALAANPDLTPDASLGFVGLVRAGGGHVRRLARGHYPRDLDWGPHGRKILFGEVGVVIMVLDLRTKRVSRMRYGSHPRWSPNGRRIVYERLGSIYVMNADGSHTKRLIKGVPRQH